MADPVRPPAKHPCGSCPYRRDVPSGVWGEEEYAKLPEYDLPIGEQPPSVFLCHQQDGRACAGWVAVHDMEESMGLRIADLKGTVEDVEPFWDYETDTPLFASGEEAAAHGLKGLWDPGEDTRRMIDNLNRKRRNRDA